MLSVRKNLTEILLEVTNEQINEIANETLSKMRSKGQNNHFTVDLCIFSPGTIFSIFDIARGREIEFRHSKSMLLSTINTIFFIFFYGIS